MASSVYGKYNEEVQNGLFDFSSDDIRAAGVDAAYTPDFDVDEFVSVIPGAAILSRSAALTVTNPLGVVDVADFTLPAVTSGKTLVGWVLYQYNVADSAARLIVFKELASGQLANGGDILCSPSNGASKVFRSVVA